MGLHQFRRKSCLRLFVGQTLELLSDFKTFWFKCLCSFLHMMILQGQEFERNLDLGREIILFFISQSLQEEVITSYHSTSDIRRQLAYNRVKQKISGCGQDGIWAKWTHYWPLISFPLVSVLYQILESIRQTIFLCPLLYTFTSSTW